MINVSLKSMGKYLLFVASLVGYAYGEDYSEQDIKTIESVVSSLSSVGSPPPPPPVVSRSNISQRIKSELQGNEGFSKLFADFEEAVGSLDKETLDYGSRLLYTLYCFHESQGRVFNFEYGERKYSYEFKSSDIGLVKSDVETLYKQKKANAQAIFNRGSAKVIDEVMAFFKGCISFDLSMVPETMTIKDRNDLAQGGIRYLIENRRSLLTPTSVLELDKYLKGILNNKDQYLEEIRHYKSFDGAVNYTLLENFGGFFDPSLSWNVSSTEFRAVEKIFLCGKDESLNLIGTFLRKVNAKNLPKDLPTKSSLESKLSKLKRDIEDKLKSLGGSFKRAIVDKVKRVVLDSVDDLLPAADTPLFEEARKVLDENQLDEDNVDILLNVLLKDEDSVEKICQKFGGLSDQEAGVFKQYLCVSVNTKGNSGGDSLEIFLNRPIPSDVLFTGIRPKIEETLKQGGFLDTSEIDRFIQVKNEEKKQVQSKLDFYAKCYNKSNISREITTCVSSLELSPSVTVQRCLATLNGRKFEPEEDKKNVRPNVSVPRSSIQQTTRETPKYDEGRKGLSKSAHGRIESDRIEATPASTNEYKNAIDQSKFKTQKKATDKNKEIDKFQTLMDGQKMEIERLRRVNEKLENEIETVVASKEKELKEAFGLQESALKKMIEDLRETIDVFKTTLGKTSDEKKALEKDKLNLENENRRLKASLETERNGDEKAQRNFSEDTNRLNNGELDKKAKEYEALLGENHQLKAKNAQLQKDLEDERNKKPEERVVRRGGTTRTVENTEKIDALTKELSNRDNQLNQQQNALSGKDNEINRLRQQINQLRNQSNEQKPESNEITEELEAQRQDLARLQAELENQQNELNGREADIAKREQLLQQKTQEAQGAILQIQNMNNGSNIQRINGGQNESNKSSNVELMPQNVNLSAVGA